MEKITKKDYQNALKVIDEYKSQLKNKLYKPLEKCNHDDYYRYWYSEDHLINVCRYCFHEWEEEYRPFLLSDWWELTSGKYKQTKQDIENYEKFKNKIDKIDKL